MLFLLTILAAIAVSVLALVMTIVSLLVPNLLQHLSDLGVSVEGGTGIVWLTWSALLMLCLNAAISFFIV